MNTKVKFCGITRSEDARIAVEVGVDALGFVFDARSPRAISAVNAQGIVAAIPVGVRTVALFRDADTATVQAVLCVFRPSLLQFHGEEPPEFCRSFGLPYLKAVAMAVAQDLVAVAQRYASAEALLLDAHAPGAMGGTGRSLDWSLLPRKIVTRSVLAGGLKPENVAQAITMTRPCAVDVSSGIESAPGLKDPQKMQRFMQEVRRADAQRH